MPEITSYLPHWLWPGDDRPPEEIDDEIAAELQLHVDLLTEENERQGLPPDEARRKAEQRFGDLEAYQRRCRKIQQGDVPMLKRIQAVLTALLLAAVVFLGVRQWRSDATSVEFMDQTTAFLMTIKSDIEQLGIQQSSELKAADESEQRDYVPTAEIRVIDEAGKPIPDARLSITWCDEKRDHFESFETKADAEGVLKLALRYEDGSRVDSMLATAPGYTFVSRRLSRPDGYSEPIVITLPKAVETSIRFLTLEPKSDDAFEDRASKPRLLSGRVYVVKRVDRSGESYSSTWNRARSAYARGGIITVNWFAEGDVVDLRIESEGQTHYSYGLEIFPTANRPDGPLEAYARAAGGGGFGGGGGHF